MTEPRRPARTPDRRAWARFCRNKPAVIGPNIELRRIWHEVLHDQPCHLDVAIFASNGTLVRHYFQGTLGRTICNWYWDAMDDSGCFVEPGKYRAVITDCAKPFYENLTIEYVRGEQDFSIPDSTQSLKHGLLISVLTDSFAWPSWVKPSASHWFGAANWARIT